MSEEIIIHPHPHSNPSSSSSIPTSAPQPVTSNPSPPALDPPFRGYIETTYDALLVFEAARRGMIPRVTRRLIERERGMVQSGAVFVFDEHESGIKRWTDGLVWSPSRILGNFLVYRETDKRRNSGNKEFNTPQEPSSSNQIPFLQPTSIYPDPHRTGTQQISNPLDPLHSHPPGPGPGPGPGPSGSHPRPRSSSDSTSQPKEAMDKNKERALVGSLTNSYKFKEGGLVKKTMSVNVNGFAQHMVSYYSVADVLAGRLRTPSTIVDLVSLEISHEYMQKQNFRFPPVFDVGPDGLLQYKGESDEPSQPQTPYSAIPLSGVSQSSYGPSTGDMDYSRPSTASAGVLTPISPNGYHPYPASSSGYFEQQQNQYPMPPAPTSTSVPSGGYAGLARMAPSPVPPPLIRQASEGSVGGRSTIPGHPAHQPRSSRRYDPYAHYTPHSAKSPHFSPQAARSPSLPDDPNRHRTPHIPPPPLSQQQQQSQQGHMSDHQSTGYLPVNDAYGYRDSGYNLNTGGSGLIMPSSAPGTFSTFAASTLSAPSSTYHQHLAPGSPNLRPSSSATIRGMGGLDMGRSLSTPSFTHDGSSGMYPTPTDYPWVKQDPDGLPGEQVDWTAGKGDLLHAHAGYASLRY